MTQLKDALFTVHDTLLREVSRYDSSTRASVKSAIETIDSYLADLDKRLAALEKGLKEEKKPTHGTRT